MTEGQLRALTTDRHAFWRVWCAVAAILWGLGRILGLDDLSAFAATAALNILPGLALLRVLGITPRTRSWELFAAGTLSAPLLVLPILLARYGRDSIDPAVAPSLVAFAIFALWPDPRSASRIPAEPPDDNRMGRLVVLLGILVALVVVIGYLNPRSRVWSDAFYQTAIVGEIERVGIPPTYPHFAGHALNYHWYYYVYIAALRQWVSANTFTVMAWANVWVALLIPIGTFCLARAMRLAQAAALASAVGSVLLLNPLGPALFVFRAFVGERAGWHELGHVVANADSAQTSLAWHFPYFQSSLLARLWTASAYNYALLLVLLCFERLHGFLERPGVRTAGLLGASQLLLFLWYPMTALQYSIGAGLGVGAWAIAQQRDPQARPLRVAAVCAALLLLAYLGARPYLSLITRGFSMGHVLRIEFSVPNAISLALSLGPILLISAAGLSAIARQQRVVHVGSVVGMCLVFLLVDLAGMGEDKFFHPFFLVIASGAGAGLLRLLGTGPTRRVLATGLLACGLIGVMLTTVAFVRDPRSRRSLFDPARPNVAEFLTRDEASALTWIRERAPREAVFLQPQRPLGTEPILVFGKRRLYVGLMESFYRAVSLEPKGVPPVPAEIWSEVLRRERLQERVFGDSILSQGQLDTLRRAPGPLYVWWDSSLAGGRLSPTLADTVAVTREVFRSPTVRILELRR